MDFHDDDDHLLDDNFEIVEVGNNRYSSSFHVSKPLLKNYLPLRVRVKGLSYMNDDPKNIDVLYACVQDEHGMTQKLADALVEYFSNAGFVNKWEHGRGSVKLHVTLLNPRFKNRSVENDENSPRRQVREKFDSSDILNKFADFDFGVAEVKAIHLSQMKTVAADGYYQSTCIISFN